MNSIYFGALVGCICTYAVAVGGHPQFYYTVPAPAQPAPAATYYSTSFGPNTPFSFGAPPAPFNPRSFGPSQAYYTTHQTFGSSPVGYQTFAEHTPNGIVQAQTPELQQQSAFAQVPTTTVFSTGPSDQYRGFAYHTQSTNGASANVFFLTGPEAHQIRNLHSFTSNIGQNDSGNQTAQKARTLASNTVDSNATNKNQQQQIVETLSGPTQETNFDAIRTFLENPQVGFQHFYSTNGQLFTRPVQDQSLNLPANTVLLPAPISIQAFGNLGLNSRFAEIESATTTNATATNATTTQKAEEKGEEAAESVVADIKVKPNANVATDESSTTSNETASASTSASTTEAAATTSDSTTAETSKREAPTKEEAAPTKEEAPTVKEARSIKQESSTTEHQPSTTAKTESSSEKLVEAPEGTAAYVTSQESSTTKKA